MKVIYTILCSVALLVSVPAYAAHFSPVMSNTGSNATILITAENPPEINSVSIAVGDEIGIFTSRGICAGAGVWNDENLSITVWGDDPEETGVNGFVADETYIFKLWIVSDSKEYSANAVFMEGSATFSPNGITILSSLTVFKHFNLDVSNTGIASTVTIPSNNPPKIYDIILAYGDEIGIFTPRGRCAGLGIWDGNDLIITVWGDDPDESEIRGFAAGEAYRFVLWDASVNEEYISKAAYQVGNGTFIPDSITIVKSLTYPILDELHIPLQAGWNHISSNVIPNDDAMETVFEDIIENVLIVKNGDGEVNWPQYKIKQIEEWSVTDGYQVKMSAADTLVIAGTVAQPEGVAYALDGWNFISFTGVEGISPEDAFSRIVDDIIIVKEGLGRVYWPKYGISQITSLHAGRGYFIKVSAPVAFSYASSVSKAVSIAVSDVSHFITAPKTDNNATVLVAGDIQPSIDGLPLTSGDEIGVFTSEGICAGAGVWKGENLAITVWGDDAQTPDIDGIQSGETYRFIIWDRKSDREVEASATFASGESSYTVNALVVLETLLGEHESVFVDDSRHPQQFSLSQNFPNPFNPTTTVSFSLPRPNHVTLKVYNSVGEQVAVLADGQFSAGQHTVALDASGFAAGLYFYRIEADSFMDVRKMMVVK